MANIVQSRTTKNPGPSTSQSMRLISSLSLECYAHPAEANLSRRQINRCGIIAGNTIPVSFMAKEVLHYNLQAKNMSFIEGIFKCGQRNPGNLIGNFIARNNIAKRLFV